MKKISSDLDRLLESLRTKINEVYHAAGEAREMLIEEMGESANSDFLLDIENSAEHSAHVLELKIERKAFNKE